MQLAAEGLTGVEVVEIVVGYVAAGAVLQKALIRDC